MAHRNDPEVVARLLTAPGRWAVVGLSTNTARPAHRIAALLQTLGEPVVPVHPRAEQVHGARGDARLADVPGHPDVVMDTCPAIEAPRLGLR